MNSANHKTQSLVRRTLRWGLAISLLLHAGLLMVMVFGTVRVWFDERPLLVIRASTSSARDAEPDASMQATVVIKDDDSAPTDIQQQLLDSLSASEQLTEAERMESLDDAANRLKRISSEASIDDVAKRLQSWLGLTPRAERPATEDLASEEAPVEPQAATEPQTLAGQSSPEAAESTFDFDTAQLHDVKRIEGPDNRAKYVCVMLDASGRTMDVPLSEAEGEPIYTLMEKIKASPLLEQIYRQIAMPMLDQMVRAEQAAASAADAAKPKAVGEPTREAPTNGPPLEDDVSVPR